MKGKEIPVDESLVARCGLYCGACRAYLKGRCPGCTANERATWCGVRTCTLEREYVSCADCTEYTDPSGCKRFNNPVSRIIGFIFRSDRKAGIEYIRGNGAAGFARYMAEGGRQAVRR